MDALRQWALCLIIGAAAGTFVMAVSPRGAMDKTVRAVVGIFVVAAICSPLAGLLKTDFTADAFAEYEYALQNEEDMYDYMLEAYRTEVEKRILSAADEMGTEIREIFISADIDANNCIIIQEITVTLASDYSDRTADFSRFLSEKTGVNVSVNAE